MLNKEFAYEKHRFALRRENLRVRSRIQARIREWFLDQGFSEVETPILQLSPGNETHLHGFETELISIGLEKQRRYLHTSPEFAMKKLLSYGESKIFSFSRVFRNRERGGLHSPEFTMLEWYRVGEDYTVLMEDAKALLGLALDEAERKVLSFHDKSNTLENFERLSFQDAFLRYADIDLFAIQNDKEKLKNAALIVGVRVAQDDSFSDMLSKLLIAKIDPHLGATHPTFLDEYPILEAALARPSPHNPLVAERFELFACGVELMNAFGELTNPQEQRNRFMADMALKAEIYGESYPIDESFIEALSHLPPCSGAAMGFDRLIMLALGASHIEEVLWHPVP